MRRGRRSGYTHSDKTKEKISKTMSKRAKTEKHRANISAARYDLDAKCAKRLQELKNDYPDQEIFFDENEPDLLFAMQSVRSEKELNHIRNYVETGTLRPDEPYQYYSSSCYAAEDVMIELLDFKRFLQKYH